MYHLLNKELSYAMNEGNIEHVEACFHLWVLIFKAVGKYKYNSQIVQHVTNLKEVYPEDLK